MTEFGGPLPVFYGVRKWGDSWTCDCPDFVWRKERGDSVCKHILMVIEQEDEK